MKIISSIFTLAKVGIRYIEHGLILEDVSRMLCSALCSVVSTLEILLHRMQSLKALENIAIFPLVPMGSSIHRLNIKMDNSRTPQN